MNAKSPNLHPERLLLTVREAAALLGVSPRTIWRLINSGDLRVVRVGRSVRFAREALEAFIERGGVR